MALITGFSYLKTDNKLVQYAGELRLLVPVAAIGLIALFNFEIGDPFISAFHLLSRKQFLGAAFGFLSYFYAILYSEVAKEFRINDLLGFLPGSISEALRLSKSQSKNEVKVPYLPLMSIIRSTS